ncbi:Transcriptional regulator, contains XRE-family HTH domain [Fibrobacter sp. UWOV1]|uniref:helix-turn-helix domain-containing protein n=1 Tax=Fibrobacter sp. UWOV1 TaxID=1896215 RepID=UPI000922EF06|nr:helix-turn-helix domain-containing protein [Fibrobacter sp. UWOV1]SHL80857.1 Transcriptional regulator, contains XRE-family HTH domain [Fibrobacter sp. UWOV1]
MFGDKIKAFAQKKYGADKHLAAALGMSPQQLAAYTAEKRKPGFEILQKLAGLGCSVSWILDDDKTIDELNNSFNFVKGDSENKGILDLSGALELSNTPASRLAQLVGVSPATLDSWRQGTATPTVEELSRLFNQVVALALSSRHAATTPEAENPPTQATA